MPPIAKKSLGQHFLKTPAVSARIVDLLRLHAADQVLEIGPGPGALTGLLTERAPAALTLIEKDDHWAAEHARRLAGHANARVLHEDALAFDWTTLSGPWKIISNLPYNVASPLIWDIVSQTPQLERAVFMVQKEVAERIAAGPGGRDYGALSVWVQSFVSVEWGFVVGPGHFSPPPKVDSAVIAMSALPVSTRPDDPKGLAIVLKLCFQQRRKQLQAILRHHGVAEAKALLEELGIDPTARPETLTCAKFHALAAKSRPLLLTSPTKHG